MKDDAIQMLKTEATKRGSHESSRLANLNQAMMQAKQACTQLTEENEHLKAREHDLSQKIEQLEKELSEKSNELAMCKDKEPTLLMCPATPIRRGSHHVPSTPAKPIPEETQLDTLQAENAKLKRDLECVQTNFQLTSQKSLQLKKEKKEMEVSLSELQSLFDKVAAERDGLQARLNEAKVALVNKLGLHREESEKMESMTSKVAVLEEELDKFQKQNIELQEKLQTELSHSLRYQDAVEKMDKQMNSLRQEKTLLETELEEAQTKLERLEGDLSCLQQSSQSVSEVSAKMVELRRVYASQIDSLKLERNEFERKLAAAIKDIEESQDQVRDMTETRQSLETKVSVLEARNAALFRENKALSNNPTNELSDLQSKYVELAETADEKDSRIHELEGKVKKLKAQVHDLEKTKSKLSRESSRHLELANKLQKALEMQETSNFELEEAKKQNVHENSTLEKELLKVKEEISAIQDQKASLEDEVVQLTKRFEEAEQRNFELTTKLDGIEFVTESARLSSSEAQEKISDLEESIDSLKAILLEKEAQLTSFKFTNELMEGENSTLLSQVTSLSEMVTARNGKIDSLQAQLSKYDIEMGEIAETIAQLETVHGSCAKVKQELEEKIESLKDGLQEEFENKKENETKILSLKLDIKQTQECNNCLEAVNAELQDKIQTQFTKIDELKDLQENSKKRVKELQLEVEIKSDSLREALEKIAELERCLIKGQENTTSSKGKVKSIFKSSSGSALHPIQNLVD